MIVADYEGVEGGPWTPSQLKVYRQSLLEKSQWQVDLIRDHIKPNASVLELGTGNGRLLFALQQAGLLAFGHGVDLSTTRIAFAKQWAKDLGSTQISFAVEDLREALDDTGECELVVCVTGCFNYFPLDEAKDLLARIRWCGMQALFELYYPPKYVQALLMYEPVVRFWDELPAADPWDYYLHEWTRGPDGYGHRKTFISTAYPGKVDSRMEVLHYYKPEEFSEMLRDAGFKKQRYTDYDGDRLVVIAE